jgi:hypothetical protein
MKKLERLFIMPKFLKKLNEVLTMSVKHATQEPRQAEGWDQGINFPSGRKSKKAIDPNSKLAELAAKKYKDERLKVRRILTVAVSQALKDELAEFESQVLDCDLPMGFFSQHAQLEDANYGEMAMLSPCNVDSVEPLDLTCLDGYELAEVSDRYNYLVDRQVELDTQSIEEMKFLKQWLDASIAHSD